MNKAKLIGEIETWANIRLSNNLDDEAKKKLHAVLKEASQLDKAEMILKFAILSGALSLTSGGITLVMVRDLWGGVLIGGGLALTFAYQAIKKWF